MQDGVMSLHDEVSAQLLRLLDGASDQRAALNDATRLLGKWRSVLIANTLDLVRQQVHITALAPCTMRRPPTLWRPVAVKVF